MLTAEEYARVDWILAKAQDALEALSKYEQGFVVALTVRLAQRGHTLVVTEPMWEILETIRGKAV